MSKDGFIPFNRPLFLEAGMANVRAAFQRHHVSGDGIFTRQCQGFFERIVGARKALLTTSCSDALELSAMLLGIGPGDEVIVPSFTFVTSASAFVLRGAIPVFVDVRADTLNIDERLLEPLISTRTKAAVVVHYAGVACEMDAIVPLLGSRGITLVEDNAHGCFGRYAGRPLGSFGQLSTLSFHETKNLSCGEGGALIINDPRYVERAEILREKGTNRSRFFRGEIDKYSWIDVGSSFLPSDVLAALLWAQIEAHEDIQVKRRDIYRRYEDGLAGWASANGVQLPHVPASCESSHHMFWVLMPTPRDQKRFIQELKDKEINAVFHYQPLHLTPMGRTLGGRPGQCPVAESVTDRIVRLPFFYDLDPDSQDRVIAAVRSFKCD